MHSSTSTCRATIRIEITIDRTIVTILLPLILIVRKPARRTPHLSIFRDQFSRPDTISIILCVLDEKKKLVHHRLTVSKRGYRSHLCSWIENADLIPRGAA